MTDSERQLSVLEWAQERLDNSIRIAATKQGEDRAGWIEDGAYWTAIVAALASCPTVEQREQALQMAYQAGCHAESHASGASEHVLRMSNAQMAEARRLLGLAPTGE